MNTLLKKIFIGLFLIGLMMPSAITASADDLETYTVIIKDHTFSPAELTIPARKKVKLLVQNQDPTPEEFESYDLNREKIVPGNGEITVFIGPVKPGRYKFFGDFHKEAQGIIIAQ